jgi:hypothetical protein
MSRDEDKDTARLVLSLVLSAVGMGVTFGGQVLLAFVLFLFGPKDLHGLLSGPGRTEALYWGAFALPGAAAGLGAWWPWRAVVGPVGLLLLSLAGASCCAAPQLAWMLLRFKVPAELWMVLPPLATFIFASWMVQTRRPAPPDQPPG